jgi:hypothetical protein
MHYVVTSRRDNKNGMMGTGLGKSPKNCQKFHLFSGYPIKKRVFGKISSHHSVQVNPILLFHVIPIPIIP